MRSLIASVSNLLCDLLDSVLTEGDESGCQWSTGFEQPHCSPRPQILKHIYIQNVYLNEMKQSKIRVIHLQLVRILQHTFCVFCRKEVYNILQGKQIYCELCLTLLM